MKNKFKKKKENKFSFIWSSVVLKVHKGNGH